MPPKRNYRRKPRKNVYAKRLKNQRGAYKPRQKKQFMMKRQPFVETKKTTNTILLEHTMNPLIVPADPTAPRYREWRNTQISPIDHFLFMARGQNFNQMTGRDLFSKYLQQKIEIELPQGSGTDTSPPGSSPETNRPFGRITQPLQLYVVWGWIKRPMGNSVNSDNTPLTIDDVMNEVDNITASGNKLLGNINTRDTRESDFLTFKDKRKNIWTMKKKLLKPSSVPVSVKVPTSNQISQYYTLNNDDPPTDATQGEPQHAMADFGDFRSNLGYPNRLEAVINWKTSRKMRYHPFTDTPGGFARDSWIPYSYIIVPKQFQDAVSRSSPNLYRYGEGQGLRQYYDLVGNMNISTSMCHWFSDS